MIFKTVFKRDNKHLVKLVGLEPGDDKEGTWANTSVKVYNWAKSKYNEGDEVGVEYSKKNGQYFVTRITAPDGGSKETPPDEPSKETPKNTATPPQSSYTGGYKSTKDAEAIKRQAILKACCNAVIVLQGHISDPETLGDAVLALYEKFYKKISE